MRHICRVTPFDPSDLLVELPEDVIDPGPYFCRCLRVPAKIQKGVEHHALHRALQDVIGGSGLISRRAHRACAFNALRPCRVNDTSQHLL